MSAPNNEPAPDSAPDSPAASPLDDLPSTELVLLLGRGEIKPDQLTPEIRKRCVDYLAFDGFGQSEIAQILNVSDRTVRRILANIRDDEALAPDPRLGDRLLGQLQRTTLASIDRLGRITRDPSTPPYARLWTEEAITRTYNRFVETAHRLGYLVPGSDRRQEETDAHLDDPQYPISLSDRASAHSRRDFHTDVIQMSESFKKIKFYKDLLNLKPGQSR